MSEPEKASTFHKRPSAYKKLLKKMSDTPRTDAVGENGGFHRSKEQGPVVIPMPKGIDIHNACNDACDMLYGPCCCGAWHIGEHIKNEIQRLRDALEKERIGWESAALKMMSERDRLANKLATARKVIVHMRDRLRDAAQTLIDRMEIIYQDPAYQSVWASARNHGLIYPSDKTWADEFKALKEALAATKERDELKADAKRLANRVMSDHKIKPERTSDEICRIQESAQSANQSSVSNAAPTSNPEGAAKPREWWTVIRKSVIRKLNWDNTEDGTVSAGLKNPEHAKRWVVTRNFPDAFEIVHVREVLPDEAQEKSEKEWHKIVQQLRGQLAEEQAAHAETKKSIIDGLKQIARSNP